MNQRLQIIKIIEKEGGVSVAACSLLAKKSHMVWKTKCGGGRERSLFEATPKDNIVNNSSCCPWNREGKNQLDLPGRMWSSRGPLSLRGKKRVAFLCLNISNLGFDK